MKYPKIRLIGIAALVAGAALLGSGCANSQNVRQVQADPYDEWRFEREMMSNPTPYFQRTWEAKQNDPSEVFRELYMKNFLRELRSRAQ